jgi:cobalamin biosynthetic protein CobC
VNAAAELDVFRLHGGKVAAARALFPHVRAAWVDLSTGISPWSYPHEGIAREAFTRLPDPEAIAALEAAAASSFGVAEGACVVAVPGSDLALRVLGRMFVGRRVAVVRPGYSGHVLAWGDAPVTAVAARDIERVAGDHDIVVLANPNNPDGRVIERERLLAVAARLRQREGVLVVDEAFADVVPELSVCELLERASNVIVFRSFGKFFGLSGVRLGFVVTGCSGPGPASGASDSDDPTLATAFRQALGDWPVSGPAVAIGTAAYRDVAWQAQQRRRLKEAAQRLDALLTRAGLAITGGTALYRLARCEDADAVFRHLAAHGILTRPFSSDTTLLRVGLPGDESQWQRLAAALDTRLTS